MSTSSSDPKDLIIAQLLKRIKVLEKKLGNNDASNIDTQDPNSSKTTASERKALRKHIQDLENLARNKAKPIVIIKPNSFKLGQIVERTDTNLEAHKKGVIKYIACRLALPSIKECEKANCEHDKKDYIWVSWPSTKMFAYHYTKLNKMSEEDLKPRIGKELSGRVPNTPWTYNAETKLWKRDGDKKVYSQQEFDDILYFEANPWALSDAEDFMKFFQKPKQSTELHANFDIKE
jgi:hypothetical protein